MAKPSKKVCGECGRMRLCIEWAGATFSGCSSARVLQRATDMLDRLEKGQTCACGHSFETHTHFEDRTAAGCFECGCARGRVDAKGMLVEYGCAATDEERAAFARQSSVRIVR